MRETKSKDDIYPLSMSLVVEQGHALNCRLPRLKIKDGRITVLSLTESLWLLETSESCRLGPSEIRENTNSQGVPFIAQPVTDI